MHAFLLCDSHTAWNWTQLDRLDRDMMELKLRLARAAGTYDVDTTKRALEADFVDQVGEVTPARCASALGFAGFRSRSPRHCTLRRTPQQ